jgi:hydroxymethylglutaryl-CoA lyase
VGGRGSDPRRCATRWPESVTVCEVGPRDGFQMERTFIPTATKVAIIDALSRTGLREIQATSFVHPGAVPQMRDAEEVMARIGRVPGVLYRGLVLNERGAERAIASRVDRIDVVVSVTDSHSLANATVPTAEAMVRAGRVVLLARSAGIGVAVGFATALGCPFEGFPPYSRVEALVGRAVEEWGLTEVVLADTVGMAHPRLVTTMLESLRARFPAAALGLHLHNTRGMGLANVLAGLQAGVTRFDASVAGLGGCPYAPGATGNIATEDLVHMLEGMGIATGVRLDRLLEVARQVEASVGHADSAVLRAGPSTAILGPRGQGQTRAQTP